MRRDFFGGELPRHLANRNLILVEGKLHLTVCLRLSFKRR
jgi:hypothetical protein